MGIIYISQDGRKPSGITTYGRLLLTAYADARMLLLNGDTVTDDYGTDAALRIRCVLEIESHRVSAAATRLGEIVGEVSDDVTVLPNSGDTPWNATLEMVRRLDVSARDRLRVLGIVHSDVETQYALAEQHARIAPVWIGVSRRCADELRRRVGGRGVRVHELPYPVEVSDENRERHDYSGPLRLAYVGRIDEPQKRVSRLVDVFQRLLADQIDFRATVAGDGPAQSDFSRMMERLDVSIADRVTLTGALGRTGIEEVWRTHDVCLLTSAYEGMPLALLEAMAAGVCPVVMAVESGLPELLEDGINARIIPQGDAGAMAEVLRELSADRAQVERLGRAARETVRMRFSPEAHFKRLGEIIEELWSMPAPDPSKAATDPTATAVADIVDQLKQAERPVIVFGVGMFGRKVVDACMDVGLTVCALFDSDSARHGLSYRGIECRSPEDFSSIVDGVVAIGSLQLADGMRAQVADIFAQAGKRLPEMVSARS